MARLHGSVQQFLRNLRCKFLTVAALANSDPKEIEFEKPRYQKEGKWLFLKMPSAKYGRFSFLAQITSPVN